MTFTKSFWTYRLSWQVFKDRKDLCARALRNACPKFAFAQADETFSLMNMGLGNKSRVFYIISFKYEVSVSCLPSLALQFNLKAKENIKGLVLCILNECCTVSYLQTKRTSLTWSNAIRDYLDICNNRSYPIFNHFENFIALFIVSLIYRNRKQNKLFFKEMFNQTITSPDGRIVI